jgi:two-component system sensor kinase FixL
VLAAVACLVGLDQMVIQPMLFRVGAFAPTINVAGRQRMLSQKLAKESLELSLSTDTKARQALQNTLAATLAEWSIANERLQRGDPQMGIVSVATPATSDDWQMVQTHFAAMRDATQGLVAAELPNGNEFTAIVTAHEGEFLSAMDRVVKRFELSANSQIAWLRGVELFIALCVVGLIVALGGTVVKPAMETIDDQFANLEARVALRTQELSAANESLADQIQQRVEAEAKTQRLQQQLTHAGRVSALGRLTASLAHELNQPLAAIANFAEASQIRLQAAPQNDPKLHEQLTEICHAAHRAGHIVGQMRDFVRPSPANPVVKNVSELFAEVLELMRHEVLAQQVQLDVQTAELLPVCVDVIAIQQVLVNLLQNALQAVQQRPVEQRRILLVATQDEGFARIQVTDSGPGLASVDVDSLFTPFFTTKQDGLGLGLSICRGIVERHEGRIWAETLATSGARFSFTLPLASANGQQATSVLNDAAGTTA